MNKYQINKQKEIKKNYHNALDLAMIENLEFKEILQRFTNIVTSFFLDNVPTRTEDANA